MLCKAELIYGLFHMHLESRPRGFNLLGIISYTFLFDLRCSDVVEVDFAELLCILLSSRFV